MATKKRRVFEAKAVRDTGGWWAVKVPGIKFGFTQARRLSEIESMTRDMVANMLDIDPDSFDVSVSVDMPEASLVAVVDELRTHAENTKTAADTAVKAAAIALKAADVPVRDIATLLHVSPGWVSVLTKEAA